MKPHHKTTAALVGAALFVALGGVLSFWIFQQIETAADDRKRSFILLSRANDVLGSMIDAETGQRGFSLTGDEALLEPYLAVRDRVTGQLEELRQLSLHHTAHAHLDRVAPLVEAKLAELAQIILLRRQQNLSAVVALVVGDQGKRVMDSIRAEMAAFIKSEEASLAERDGQLQSTMRRLFVMIVMASALALLCAVGFAYLLYRDTRHRLKNLVHLETQRRLELQTTANEQLRVANTTLQRSEENLRFHEALLRETGQIAKVGGWSFDVTTGAGYWTDEVARIHDLDPGLPVTQEMGLTYYRPASRQVIEAALHQAVHHGTPYDLELEITSASGVHKWVRTIAHPVTEHGKVVRLRGSFQDISDRKRAEAQIRQLNAELEQRVLDRTAQLAAANEELEAFSYSVSHDLRTPLRAVDGFSQAVLEDFGPQLPEEGHRYLQTIRTAARQMGTLIDDLLAFAQLSRLELSKRPIATTQLVRDVLDGLGSPWPGRHVDLLLGELPDSPADPALLKQVWVNLLSNALKYTRKRAEAQIEIGCVQTDGLDTFFVRDNGCGFDMAHGDKLFGVFQRLHRAEDYEGTGVGLAIVHRIVQRHGGRVWADAAIDRGATFYFTLQTTHPL